MNECKICSKDIKKDSQYINGNYYHNECIEKLEHNWNELKRYLIKEQARIVIENTNEDEFIYTDLLNKIKELEEGGNNE